MALRPVRGKTHEERLESFYSKQVDAYDRFRKRLLTGRDEMMNSLPVHPGDIWVDMGCGTGANLTMLAPEKLATLKKIYLVDLTESMLRVADERIARMGWNNVETLHADATTWSPQGGEQVDAVLFSYSLTMIPDWFAAIDRAYEALKPGGLIGVVDFYIARKYPGERRMRQSFSTRWFWPIWFSLDNLFLSNDILPYLSRKFEEVTLLERADRLPYCPIFWKKMPRFVFVGRKRV
ncbi:MAG: class I SAM-dependent methyltransferase [Planctomycetia bacterium]|nr:class I SAM-dependent methyltransferase [Planctomycetia bacterium]